MSTYLVNAWSINMLQHKRAKVDFAQISANQAVLHLSGGFQNAIGHPDTANVVHNTLAGLMAADSAWPQAERQTVKMGLDDQCVVAQYSGPRLPEGATELPEGATIQFWIVRITDAWD